MAVIYGDIEATLVTYFKSVLDPEIYVATKKAAPDMNPQPEQQVVILVAWAGDKEFVTKYAGVQLEIYADGDVQASNLALLVEAHLRQATVGPIKRVDILAGPIRLGDATNQEKRSISAEVVVQATNI